MKSDTNTISLRRVARVVNGGTPGKADEYWNGMIPWATPVDLGKVHGDVLDETGRYITEAGLLDGSSLAPAGSVIISSRAPIGYVAINAIPMAFNQGCKAIVPRDASTDVRYLKYSVQSQTSALRSMGQGSTFLEVSANQVASTLIPWSPFRLQQQIADYLDHETAEIDAFVEDQHKILHLVSERRWSAIDRAIEQGKERVPLRRLAKYLTSGSRNWSSLRSESGDPFVRITNISRNHVRILSEDMKFVAGVEDAEGARAKIQMGDILMSITADLGSVALADESIEGGYTSQHVCLIRPNNHLADPKYVAYALLSSKVKAQIAEKSYGGTKIQLSLEDVRELEIPLPPLQEQRRVAQQCEDFVTTTEGLSSELQRIIALSRERRAALITAAVTGQIDVTAKNKPAAEQLEDDVAQGLHREYA